MNNNSDTITFHIIKDPAPDQLGRSTLELLQHLDGPSHIIISGEQRGRCRVVVTLLHGNEPSGLEALFYLIQESIKPIVDTHFFIPNVVAALKPPEFTNRNLPGERDLNRCFSPPYDDYPGKLASALLTEIHALKPEAVIDIHNTSGAGPSFGVSTFMDKKHDALFSLFTLRAIITDLRLGALMELSETFCPTVTIECGGVQDNTSLEMAIEGLTKYMSLDNILEPDHTDIALDYYFNPLRLELKDKSCGLLSFGRKASPHGGLTLFPDIEKFNFNIVNHSQSLGFLEQNDFHNLVALDSKGKDQIQSYFHVQHGQLQPKIPLKFFMVTANENIARSDCLLYFVPAN